MGEADWERLRIVQGRPAPGAELTDAYNPLEAGLCHAVSVSKGCYIGQETIAKVSFNTQCQGRGARGRKQPALTPGVTLVSGTA
jgi:folate-binding protein YgfZ